MVLRKSAEDYLEAILILKKSSGTVHSIDVANHLGFSKPSVSRAVSNLRQDGYLTMESDGELLFTDKGLAAAEQVYERHTVLTKLLVSLGISEQTAANDACLIEHVISDETFDKIKDFYIHQKI